MSYSIIYDQQFVKLSNGKFIPMILAGDNNVYEYGKGNRKVGRRSRDWECWRLGGQNSFVFSVQELLAYPEGVRQREIESRNERIKTDKTVDPYSDDSFGWYTGIAIRGTTCRRTTFGNFKGVFVTGMKKALTLEQLAEFGVRLHIGTQWYHKEALEAKGVQPFSMTIHNEEELQVALKMAEACDYACSLTFYGMSDNTPKRIRQKYFPKNKREKERTSVTGFWAIRITKKEDNSLVGYFAKGTKHGGFRYGFYATDYWSKKFVKENDVNRTVNEWANKNSLYKFEKEWIKENMVLYI